jgi:hypothetical protein
MADLYEAYNSFKYVPKNFHSIEYFFTQRNLKEEHEFLDKNMNRKNKQVNIVYNFLALSIPQIEPDDNANSTIDISVFGDCGYHYKGKITTIYGSSPNFIIPLKIDKKIFVHMIHTKNETSKEYTCFIDVPKRFQYIDNPTNNLKIDSDILSESEN